jgi:hypothetical protein
MNSNSTDTMTAGPAEPPTEVVVRYELGRDMTALLPGADSGVAAELADAILSKPGLLEKLLGG